MPSAYHTIAHPRTSACTPYMICAPGVYGLRECIRDSDRCMVMVYGGDQMCFAHTRFVSPYPSDTCTAG